MKEITMPEMLNPFRAPITVGAFLSTFEAPERIFRVYRMTGEDEWETLFYGSIKELCEEPAEKIQEILSMVIFKFHLMAEAASMLPCGPVQPHMWVKTAEELLDEYPFPKDMWHDTRKAYRALIEMFHDGSIVVADTVTKYMQGIDNGNGKKIFPHGFIKNELIFVESRFITNRLINESSSSDKSRLFKTMHRNGGMSAASTPDFNSFNFTIRGLEPYASRSYYCFNPDWLNVKMDYNTEGEPDAVTERNQRFLFLRWMARRGGYRASVDLFRMQFLIPRREAQLLMAWAIDEHLITRQKDDPDNIYYANREACAKRYAEESCRACKHFIPHRHYILEGRCLQRDKTISGCRPKCDKHVLAPDEVAMLVSRLKAENYREA